VISEPTHFLADNLQQLNVLKAKSDDQQSATCTITSLQKELASEQLTWREHTKTLKRAPRQHWS
jgi:hypothetical protein